MSDENTNQSEGPLTVQTINEMMHKAITARNKSTENLIENKFAEMMTKLGNGSQAAPTEQAASQSQDPRDLKIAELERKFKESENKRQMKEREARESDAFVTVKERLAASDVRPELVDLVAKAIRHDRLYQVTDFGAISWKDSLDLDSGLSEYLNTKEAAHVKVAPKVQAQVNNRVSMPGQASNGTATVEQQAIAIMQGFNLKQ